MKNITKYLLLFIVPILAACGDEVLTPPKFNIEISEYAKFPEEYVGPDASFSLAYLNLEQLLTAREIGAMEEVFYSHNTLYTFLDSGTAEKTYKRLEMLDYKLEDKTLTDFETRLLKHLKIQSQQPQVLTERFLDLRHKYLLSHVDEIQQNINKYADESNTHIRHRRALLRHAKKDLAFAQDPEFNRPPRTEFGRYIKRALYSKVFTPEGRAYMYDNQEFFDEILTKKQELFNTLQVQEIRENEAFTTNYDNKAALIYLSQYGFESTHPFIHAFCLYDNEDEFKTILNSTLSYSSYKERDYLTEHILDYNRMVLSTTAPALRSCD
ncbi:hypothetical protein [Vibrio neonatus]|uniref:hypothetical protein n=1 Tax=Vibrio neonatus TaxID=278860 RepID=UPI0021C25848|nr:hypothetical protein [Vibrio neonatus]